MLKVFFLNDETGTKIKGNYRWDVMINDTLVAKGELKGHNRTQGWQGLLRKFVKEFCKNE